MIKGNEITLKSLEYILYGSPSPVFTLFIGRITHYDFICKFFPEELFEYKDEKYDYSTILGTKRNSSSFDRFMGKSISADFRNSFFNLLSNNFKLALEIEKNFKKEWDLLRGDKKILKKKLLNIEFFNKNNYNEWLIEYVNYDFVPERLLTILFLHAIIDKPILVLYKDNLPLQKSNFENIEIKTIDILKKEKKEELIMSKLQDFGIRNKFQKITHEDDEKVIVYSGILKDMCFYLFLDDSNFNDINIKLDPLKKFDKIRLLEVLNKANLKGIFVKYYYSEELNTVTCKSTYINSANFFDAEIYCELMFYMLRIVSDDYYEILSTLITDN